MGNIPATASESVSDDVLLRSLENQARLVGDLLTPAPNNKFLRTLACRRAGETDVTVVKVFFVKNIDLAPFCDKLKVQKSLLTLKTAPNVSAYQRFREGGNGSPAFVARQFVFANLRDRLSTRPFLTDSEKLWIAYCLIAAGRQLHDAGLAHGDIKSENVMLTSWGWPVLTDLAVFKPAFLQADQSSAPFNFFFSSGKKRCYLAPERFVTSSGEASITKAKAGKAVPSKEMLKRKFAEVLANKDADEKKAANALADVTGVPRSAIDEKDAKMAAASLRSPGVVFADADLTQWRTEINGSLLPSMDVFSIGCVLLELFNGDSEPAFEFSDALQYATKGECSRLKMLLAKVSNEGVRALIESMTSYDPAVRQSLESYSKEFSHVFPKCFDGFLFDFMEEFLTDPGKNGYTLEDNLVWQTCERYGDICDQLLGSVDEAGKTFFEGFVQSRAERQGILFQSNRKGKNTSETPSPVPSETFNPDDIPFDPLESAIRELEHNLSQVPQTQARANQNVWVARRLAAERQANEEENEEKVFLAGSAPYSQCSSAIVIINYLCIALQNASKASTQVLAMLLVKRLTLLEQNSELILTRILPFLVDRLSDSSAWVRCTAIRAITELLESVNDLPPSEAKIFNDYLMPSFADCPRDASEAVRVTFASCVPSIATSAKRFLELSRQYQTRGLATSGSVHEHHQGMLPPYDAELTALHLAVQKMIERTVEHSSQGGDLSAQLGLVHQIQPLCLFFGRDRIDTWLLPWLLSLVNARGPGNWRLTVAVLQSLAGIAAFAGDEAIRHLLPVIDDLLFAYNPPELVIEASLHLLVSLIRLNLVQEIELVKLVKKVVPMVRYPLLRVRRATLLLLATIASSPLLPHVDVQLSVAEKVRPFYSSRNNNEAEKFIVLLGKPGQSLETNALLLEQCLNTEPCASYNEWLNELAKHRSGNVTAPPSVRPRISNAGQNVNGGLSTVLAESNAVLKAMVKVHLLKTNESSFGSMAGISTGSGKDRGLRSVRNRFGIVLEEESIPPLSLLRRAIALELPETRLSLGRATYLSRSPSPVTSMETTQQAGRIAAPVVAKSTNGPGVPSSQVRKTSRASSSGSVGGGAMLYAGSSVSSSSNADWRPRGHLVSSLYEHSGPVNRIAISNDYSFIVTGSDDGTAKVWATEKLDRNPCPRARLTVEGPDNKRVVDVTCIRASNSFAMASDGGYVSLVRVDAASNDFRKDLKCDESSRLVALGTASLNDLVAASERGDVLRWDLRSGSRMENLSLLLGFGSISCMTVSPDGTWLALGTHRGVIAIFDLRFNMLLAAWRHTCSCAIHRLYCSKTSQGLPHIYVAAGPNQAVLLNVETGETRFAFACAQPEFTSDKAKLQEWKLSQEALFSKRYDAVDLQARQLDRYIQEAKFISASEHSSAFSSPHHSIRALYCPSDLTGPHLGSGYEANSLITGGSDMMVRYWDCRGGNHGSSVITTPPDDTKVKWEAKEMNGKNGLMFLSLNVARAPASSSIVKNKGKFFVRATHQDAILDITGLRMTDGARLVTAGRDGVVRIWK